MELRDPQADNSKAEAWAASQESGKSSWQTYTYRLVAQPSATPDPDNQWHDFVMGLLSDGECYVDDLSVIQSPTDHPVQLISNGDFENGAAGWRFVGNHQRSVVESDPDDPGNLTNRSPWPTLHLLREDSVSRAVAAFPDPDAIVERNVATLEKLGREGWERLFHDAS